MQYTTHYNLNLPEGTDIVNPLVQDNPNYTAIDTALYNNKLRVIGSASEVKSGTVHAITRSDTDINVFKFVATSDYATGDTFTVDGVSVTARIADGSAIPNGAFKINSTIECILDGTVLNIMNITGTVNASNVAYNNTGSGLNAGNAQDAIDEINVKIYPGGSGADLINNSTWTSAPYDQTYTVNDDGYLSGAFASYDALGMGALAHGVIITVDNVPVFNVWSGSTTVEGANTGSVCVPVKTGQSIRVRVIDGTWVGVLRTFS